MLMRDREIVASIAAGDSEGLAEAYDKYAGPLYEYCRSILTDPGGAADAVQDTFVIAAAKAAGLRDPERPGDVGVSASSGTLADGAGVAVTITADDSADGE